MLKNIILFILLFVVINTSVIYLLLGEDEKDKPKTTPLNISQVTVYPQQARLTYTQQVSLKPGDTTLIFSNIAPKIDTTSLQITPIGDLTIQKVYYRLRPLNNQNDEKLTKTLQDTLQIYEDSLEQLNIHILALEKEEAMLLANQNLTTAQEALTAEKLKEMTGFVRNRFIEIQKEKSKFNKQNKQLLAKQEKIKARWEKIKQNPQKMSSEIVVKASGINVFNGSLEISYLVNDCGWKPIYDFKLNNDTLAQLTFKAQVWQQSGINWQNVKLTISQNQPNSRKNYFNVQPQMADLQTIDDSIPAKKKSDTLAQAQKAEANISTLELKPEVSVVTPQEWTLEKNVSLSTSESQQNVVVKTVDFKPEYAFIGFPQANNQAFRAVLWRNWHKLNLPLGLSKVYEQGKLIREADLMLAMDTILQIPLQMTADIKLHRNLSKKTQTIDNQIIKEQWQYEIKLENQQKDTLNLYISELLPIIKNEGIKLEWKAANQAYIAQKASVLHWQIRLLPQSTQNINFEYSLIYSEKRKLLLQ
jgi:uncharacterized protein (TIGR02231 family)